jgi:hypothetical protein
VAARDVLRIGGLEILEREESIERKAVRLRCLHQESLSVPTR